MEDKNEQNQLISIHVPRVEDDYIHKPQMNETTKFQSTSPVWRTTIPYKL